MLNLILLMLNSLVRCDGWWLYHFIKEEISLKTYRQLLLKHPRILHKLCQSIFHVKHWEQFKLFVKWCMTWYNAQFPLGNAKRGIAWQRWKQMGFSAVRRAMKPHQKVWHAKLSSGCSVTPTRAHKAYNLWASQVTVWCSQIVCCSENSFSFTVSL